MKKILLMTILSILALTAFAQTITVLEENFDGSTSMPAGWVNDSSASIRANQGVGGTNALYANVYGQSGWIDVYSPVIEDLPENCTLTFEYKILGWNSNDPGDFDSSYLAVYVAPPDMSGYDLLWELDDHVSSAAYRTITINLEELANLTGRLNFYAEAGGGNDVDVYIDNIKVAYPIPLTDGADLAILAFTGPATWTGASTPLNITVMNVGTVAGTTYTVNILQQGVNTALYTIPNATDNIDIVALPNSYDDTTIVIPSTVYSSWLLTGLGSITLEATVTLTSATDINGDNNTKSLETNVLAERDIEVVSFTGPSVLSFPTTSTLTISLKNSGTDAITTANYTLELWEGASQVSGITLTPVAIAAGATVPVTITAADLNGATFAAHNSAMALTIKAVWAGDQIQGNNEKVLNTYVVDAIAEAGVSGSATNNRIPFGFYDHDTLVQTIYTAADLGNIPAGYITHINYTLYVNAALARDPIEIYMANSSKATFSSTTDWVAASAFECVVDNTYTLPMETTGTKSLWIPLDTPFLYTGGNLVVMTYSNQTEYASNNNFLVSPSTYTNRTLYLSADNATFVPSNPTGTGTRVDIIPQTRFAIDTTGRAGIDLAITEFTVPANIPNPADTPAPITINVVNMLATSATTYTVKVYQVGSTDVEIYSIPDVTNDIAIDPLTSWGASKEYSIPATIYNDWAITGYGNITLKAVVDISGDEEHDNDSLTRVTYRQPEKDIEVVSFTGPALLSFPTTATLNFTLKNSGSAIIEDTDYELELYEGATLIDTITFTSVELAVGATEDFEITADDLNDATFATLPNNPMVLTIKAVWAEDAIQGNNEKVLNTYIAGDVAEGSMGGDHTEYTMPFNAYYNDNVAQSIYKVADFGDIGYGYITHIMYKLTRTSGTSADTVHIYMANSTKESFSGTTDWLPQTEFTKVAHQYNLGISALPAGTHEIWIPLDAPFLYTGNNLVVMTFKDHDSYWGSSNVFYQTATENNSNVSLAKARDTYGTAYNPTNLTTGEGTLYGYKPQMRFAFKLEGGVVATGELAVTRFTGPGLIPAAEGNMVVTVRNLSSAVAITAANYSIEIKQRTATEPETWGAALYTINATDAGDGIVTDDIPANSFAKYDIIIPPAVYNTWSYVGDAAGPAVLKAEATYAADTDLTNNVANLNTSLRAPFAMVISAFTAPINIPATDSIAVTIQNDGRQAIAAGTYTVEIFQEFTIPADETNPATPVSQLLYKAGVAGAGVESAVAIPLGEAHKYFKFAADYNSWPFHAQTPVAPATFSLKAVLKYNLTETTPDSLAIVLANRTLSPANDLAITAFNAPSVIPSPLEDSKITVTVKNNSRAVVAEETYKIEIRERVIIPATEDDPAITTWPVVYTIDVGDSQEIALGASKTYDITWDDLFGDPDNDLFTAESGSITLSAKITELSTPATPNILNTIASNDSLQVNTSIAPLHDLAITAMTVPGVFPTFADTKITIRNTGRYEVDADDYEVKLQLVETVAGGEFEYTTIYTFGDTTDEADAASVALGIAETFDLIIAAEDMNLLITESLVEPGAFVLRAIIVAEADSVATNNTSSSVTTNLVDINADGIVEVGVSGTSTTTSIPFMRGYRDSIAQSIYTAAEIGLPSGGLITQLRYRVNVTSTGAPDPYDNVMIRMANTTKASFADNTWVPGTALRTVAEVEDLPVHTTGQRDIWIPIVPPFVYTGGNLVVQTSKDHDDYAYTYEFYRGLEGTNTYESMAKYTDAAGSTLNPLDPTVGTSAAYSSRYNYKPQTGFAVLLPSQGLDLSISEFVVPALLPDTEDITVTVSCVGSDGVDDYEVDIYQVIEGELVLKYSIPAGQIEPLVGFVTEIDSHTYRIPVSEYNTWWNATVPGGAITLRAEVSVPLDVREDNNARNASTTLRPAFDLEVASVTGPGIYPAFKPLVITVQNNGRVEVAEQTYSLAVAIGEGAAIHNIPLADSDAIDLGDTAIYSIPAATLNPLVASQTGDFTFNVTLTTAVAGDIATNNTGSFDTTYFTTFTTGGIAEVGIGGEASSYSLPFNTYYQDSVVQSIYKAADLDGVVAGEVTHIMYKFIRGTGANPATYPVNIWMVNYNEKPDGFTSVADWVPISEFTQVVTEYNIGLTALAAGPHDIWIPLATPFIYTGGDLVIMTYKDHSAFTGTNNLFLQTNAIANSSVSLRKATDATGSTYAGNLTSGDGTIDNFKPQMRFAFDISGDYGILAGNITDGTVALPGVRVAQGNNAVTSKSTGDYSLVVVKGTGAADVTFSKPGFVPQTLALGTLTFAPQAEGLPVATHTVSMVSVPPATVTGLIKLADTNAPVTSKTFTIGGVNVTTNASGVFTQAGLFPYVTYPVVVTMTTNSGYLTYSEDMYFTPASDGFDATTSTYTYNITIVEDIVSPLYVSASLLLNGGREVHWFDPNTNIRALLWRVSGQTSNRTFGAGEFIAAQRLTAGTLALPGNELVNNYLTAVRFARMATGNDFDLLIWVGTNLASPDVNNPTYEQQVTYTAADGYFNEVVLNKPILITGLVDIVIGIKSNNVPLVTYYSTSVTNNTLDTAFNKYYVNGAWTTILAAGGTDYADNWAFQYICLRVPASPPTPGDSADGIGDIAETITLKNGTSSRAFNNHYNVYREVIGTPFDPAEPLNTAQIGTAFYNTYTDNANELGNYRYAVVALFEGTGYPTPLHSDPVYSNTLNVVPAIYGSVSHNTLTDLSNFKITLFDSDDEAVGTPIVTGADGLFRFTPVAGTYYVTAQLQGVNLDGVPYGIQTSDEFVFAGTANVTVPAMDMSELEDVEEITIPLVTTLKGNYPNPFNPSTTIAFDLAADGHVSIDVFNIKGQKVKTLTNEMMKAGRYSVVWNGDDNIGRAVGSGVYFYRMTSGQYTKTQKMLLMK